jgi:hypothetical protein
MDLGFPHPISLPEDHPVRLWYYAWQEVLRTGNRETLSHAQYYWQGIAPAMRANLVHAYQPDTDLFPSR